MVGDSHLISFERLNGNGSEVKQVNRQETFTRKQRVISWIYRFVTVPWRRASMRGIEANIPRMLTMRSDVLPLPEGEGGVRGKGLPCRLRLSSSAVGSGLNSIENSEEPFY